MEFPAWKVLCKASCSLCLDLCPQSGGPQGVSSPPLQVKDDVNPRASLGVRKSHAFLLFNKYCSSEFSPLLLCVAVPPSFIQTPSDHEVHQGGNVELYCEATGDPAPTIRWFQNNNAVSPNNRCAGCHPMHRVWPGAGVGMRDSGVSKPEPRLLRGQTPNCEKRTAHIARIDGTRCLFCFTVRLSVKWCLETSFLQRIPCHGLLLLPPPLTDMYPPVAVEHI